MTYTISKSIRVRQISKLKASKYIKTLFFTFKKIFGPQVRDALVILVTILLIVETKNLAQATQELHDTETLLAAEREREKVLQEYHLAKELLTELSNTKELLLLNSGYFKTVMDTDRFDSLEMIRIPTAKLETANSQVGFGSEQMNQPLYFHLGGLNLYNSHLEEMRKAAAARQLDILNQRREKALKLAQTFTDGHIPEFSIGGLINLTAAYSDEREKVLQNLNLKIEKSILK